MSGKKYHDIENSLDIFYKWAKRGMIIGQIKEKYETTRWYAYLNSSFTLNDIFYPMHYYYRLPKWCRYIDDYFLTPVFGRLVYKWRKYCYNKAYKEVLTKYPDIYHCIDHPNVVDYKVIDKYYTDYKNNNIDNF